MRFCEEHWAKLCKAIKDKGLWGLVSKDGEEAARRLQDELDSGVTIKNFDPLMSAHNMIIGHALDCAGPSLMEGGKCPICYGMQFEADVANWIEYAANGSLQYALENGLVTKQ